MSKADREAILVFIRSILGESGVEDVINAEEDVLYQRAAFARDSEIADRLAEEGL